MGTLSGPRCSGPPASGAGKVRSVHVFVLGIDPGVSRCGYCCLERRGRTPRPIALGVIRTSPDDPLPNRLAELRAELALLFDEYPADVLAIEQVFFQVNVRTAMSVGQAMGLAMAEAAGRGADVATYTPNQIKQAVAGVGNAGKEQVQTMVQTLLGLAEPPRPADAADAAAVALTHLAFAPMDARVAEALR